jgi:plastocyanin
MASFPSDIQKILVSLSTADIVIEPGSTAQLIVTMTNRQDEPDRLSIEVEGIDVEWYAIPVPAVNVAPGATVTERILFKVARNSANRAGAYPFLVKVQAQETGEAGVAQAALVVKPFNFLEVELDPKRASATFFRPLNDFDFTVSNQGNAEETLDLGAFDPDDGCAYEFDTDRITLKPGQTLAVPLALRPKVSSVLGGVRLYGFTITARSVNDSYVSASVHGQVEKHALISPLMGIFLLLLSFGVAGYLFTRPHPLPPAQIHSFNAVPTKAAYGQAITLSWDVDNAQRIVIKHHLQKGKDAGEEVNNPGEQTAKVGTVQVKPEYPTTVYTIEVRGGNGQTVLTKEIKVDVAAPPIPLPAKVKSFDAEPSRIHAGDTVRLSWEASNYTQAIIDPGNNVLSAFQRTMNATPDQSMTYTLRVIGADQKPIERKINVTVIPKDQCVAEIEYFILKPQQVFVGDSAHIKWKSHYAKAVHLSSDTGGYSKDVNLSGGADIPVEVPTVFTLTVTDSAGLAVSKQVTVRPDPKPAPPDTTAPTNGGATVIPPTNPPPGGTVTPPPP